jgi:hypothetical protein
MEAEVALEEEGEVLEVSRRLYLRGHLALMRQITVQELKRWCSAPQSSDASL